MTRFSSFDTSKRKPIRRKSKKRAAREASLIGQQDLAYMACVKELPCAACGASGPSDAHHCKDKPPHAQRHDVYTILPIGRKSGARDTIPLCKACHQDGPEAYHRSPDAWNAKHGPDYSYIIQTRNLVDEMLQSVTF